MLGGGEGEHGLAQQPPITDGERIAQDRHPASLP
jgi:hypothetical protein